MTRRKAVEAAVVSGGAMICEPSSANAMIWISTGDMDELRETLTANPGIRWVQLPWAGVENFAASGSLVQDVLFTCAKGLFAEQVAEHALAGILAAYRHFVPQARRRGWTRFEPISLHRKRVTILGGGGIAADLVKILQPFDVDICVVRRSSQPLEGAGQTLTLDTWHQRLPDTDVLVVALALTPQTVGVIGRKELELLPGHAIVVNVARGRHMVTDDLLAALTDEQIAGAVLDVTDPEPLPVDHPLWSLDNVLITSHCADSYSFVTEQLSRRVVENIGHFQRGERLTGLVDSAAGY